MRWPTSSLRCWTCARGRRIRPGRHCVVWRRTPRRRMASAGGRAACLAGWAGDRHGTEHPAHPPNRVARAAGTRRLRPVGRLVRHAQGAVAGQARADPGRPPDPRGRRGRAEGRAAAGGAQRRLAAGRRQSGAFHGPPRGRRAPDRGLERQYRRRRRLSAQDPGPAGGGGRDHLRHGFRCRGLGVRHRRRQRGCGGSTPGRRTTTAPTWAAASRSIRARSMR